MLNVVSIVEVDHCSTRFDPVQQLHMKSDLLYIRVYAYVSMYTCLHVVLIPHLCITRGQYILSVRWTLAVEAKQRERRRSGAVTCAL